MCKIITNKPQDYRIEQKQVTMAIYTCNRYRIVVFILIILILWQVFRLLPYPTKQLYSVPTKEKDTYFVEKDPPNLYEPSILQMEDDNYNKHKTDKIKVRVYYEALCPDSKHFFMKHLDPTTEQLYEFMDVTLIPYGKATTSEENGQYSFKCQHGEEECYANKVHSCAIEILNNSTLAVKFITCMMVDNIDAIIGLERCGTKMDIPTEEIIACADSNISSNLLKKHGDDTHGIKPNFIPTVVVNGSNGNLGPLLKNFRLEICKLIDMPLPPPCLL